MKLSFDPKFVGERKLKMPCAAYCSNFILRLMIALLLKAGKVKVLAATGILLALVVMADWAVGRNVSLAALYILPMMLGAIVLPPWGTLALAIFCSYLRALPDVPGSKIELMLRFIFAVVAYFISGQFVTALVRKHEQAVEHLSKIGYEQALRQEAEEQVKVLVESSPAAVLTVDAKGVVLSANGAANTLFAIPRGETLQGRPIGPYLPMLTDALALDPQRRRLRTTVQCQGHRDNGEIFLAHIWFSSYAVPDGKRLAAIIVDSSEELRDLEEHGLRQLLKGNRIATAAIAHEVRNFCGAMSLLCANLSERHGLAADADLQGLVNLAMGLESIASLELKSMAAEVLQDVPLRKLLDDLRIVIEPDWREIEGTVRWHLPPEVPFVIGEPHGLLQAFLNLVQNSHRAVQQVRTRQLDISIWPEGQKVIVRFRDSGPGIPITERLFEPFQEGAAGSGLGLYLSRFIVRSYGGELRFEPQSVGSCFAVELLAVAEGQS
jgi:signal transduction histidine kinase